MSEIKVKDFLTRIISSDRLQVKTVSGEILFTGWASDYDHKDDEADIKAFRAVPELYSKKWSEKKLMPPMEPDVLPEYEFSDLDMKLYYTLII